MKTVKTESSDQSACMKQTWMLNTPLFMFKGKQYEYDSQPFCINQQLYLFIYSNLFTTGGIFTYMQAITINCELLTDVRLQFIRQFYQL